METVNLTDVLFNIGFILIMLYSFITILGLSIMLSLIAFHIVWSFIESPIINILGHDFSSIIYWLGICLCIVFAIKYAKNYINKQA
jgi:hypothetical protein